MVALANEMNLPITLQSYEKINYPWKQPKQPRANRNKINREIKKLDNIEQYGISSGQLPKNFVGLKKDRKNIALAIALSGSNPLK